MSEIKPCPFCGKKVDLGDGDTLYPDAMYWSITNGIKHYVSFRDRLPGDNPCWIMVCNEVSGGCGAEMHADSKDEVLEKWNKRV